MRTSVLFSFFEARKCCLNCICWWNVEGYGRITTLDHTADWWVCIWRIYHKCYLSHWALLVYISKLACVQTWSYKAFSIVNIMLVLLGYLAIYRSWQFNTTNQNSVEIHLYQITIHQPQTTCLLWRLLVSSDGRLVIPNISMYNYIHTSPWYVTTHYWPCSTVSSLNFIKVRAQTSDYISSIYRKVLSYTFLKSDDSLANLS